MKGNSKDLRDAAKVVECVKQLASGMFGFNAYLVKPLEADANDPSSYCMFEVNGIQYQVSKGVLSIYSQEQR